MTIEATALTFFAFAVMVPSTYVTYHSRRPMVAAVAGVTLYFSVAGLAFGVLWLALIALRSIVTGVPQ